MKVQDLYGIPIELPTVTAELEPSDPRSRKIFAAYTRPIPGQGTQAAEIADRTSSLIIYFMDLKKR